MLDWEIGKKMVEAETDNLRFEGRRTEIAGAWKLQVFEKLDDERTSSVIHEKYADSLGQLLDEAQKYAEEYQSTQSLLSWMRLPDGRFIGRTNQQSLAEYSYTVELTKSYHDGKQEWTVMSSGGAFVATGDLEECFRTAQDREDQARAEDE